MPADHRGGTDEEGNIESSHIKFGIDRLTFSLPGMDESGFETPDLTLVVNFSGGMLGLQIQQLALVFSSCLLHLIVKLTLALNELGFQIGGVLSIGFAVSF